MDRAERFVTVCRLMNKVLEQRGNTPGEIRITEDEIDQLVLALEYFRDAMDPSSGDILTRTEFRCPECGTKNEFRAQDGQVSLVENHPEVGVEVVKVHGIAQCSECKRQLKLTQFEPVQLAGFDEAAWNALYEQEYKARAVVTKLQSE
ncbi:hypothetical protein SY89_03512 [Halolamina pelagica]|uniref:Uncharacterized protein n=2 Tax=Halolamina pelagica TaxID=699431 RepID=A0A0P7FQX7_9EURY|nr:hypothetical protein SY89_03132 [Halolamina pelagica]KPN29278.1 hypothetical protein SY89_03512 [Halolamina pelagica]